MSFSRRMILLFTLSTVIPLLMIGIIAVLLSYYTAKQNITQRNAQYSRVGADEIQHYLQQEIETLHAIAQNIEKIGLNTWQKEMILKNFVIRFPSLRSITLVNGSGKLVATSKMERHDSNDFAKSPAFEDAFFHKKNYFSPLQMTNDLLPIIEIAVPVVARGQPTGVLIAALNIIHLWKIIDGIRAGNAGYSLLLDESNRLIAHGDPRGKALVLKRTILPTSAAGENAWGEKVLKSEAKITPTGWRLIIEQPFYEAFANARQIALYLTVATFLVVVAAVAVGLTSGSRIVSMVGRLIEGTRRIAGGELHYQVKVDGSDELARLAAAFNTMSHELLTLQKEVAKRERTSIFGRVATALAHDLKHPINNIRRSAALLEEKHDDPSFRLQFAEVLQRELTSLNYLVTQLRDLSERREIVKIPLHCFNEIRQVLASFEEQLSANHIKTVVNEPDMPLYILGDMMAIRRLFTNIISNAIEAMDSTLLDDREAVLTITATEELTDATAKIIFSDSGCGIESTKLATIFEEFQSTKTKNAGFGLGMPIIRRICEEHGGTIEIASTQNVGTQVTIHLPLAKGAIAQLHQSKDNELTL